jgi:serine/threonine protein kinase
MSEERAAPAGRRFQVLEPLGQGAFGTVYRARMLGEGGFVKEVALKLLRADLDGEKAEKMARRNRDEARVLGLVRHRALLHVDGLLRLGGRWAVVMELVEGCNLKDLLRLGPVPPSVAIAIVGEVAGGLAAAWDAAAPDGAPLHLVHRDVKPANVQLSRAGDVKLLDFGVARARFDGREAETEGMVLGTLRYMAPERFDGFDGPEGDVYALGVVLAELLTREPVAKTSGNRERHEATVAETLARVRGAVPPTPDPAPFVDLVARMLAYEPSGRPTAREVEQQSWDLRRTWSEPRLPDFARAQVPRVQGLVRPTDTDPLVGGVLTESGSHAARPRRAIWPWVVGGTSAGLAVVGAMLATGGGSMALLAAWWTWVSEPRAAVVVAAPPERPGPLSGPRPTPEPVPPPPPPEPVVAPGPSPAATPAAPPPTPRTAASTPAPSTPAPTGTVTVTGDVAVVLVGPGGRRPPGQLPVGTWEARAAFGTEPEQAVGTVEVRDGRTTEISCVAAFRMCKVRAGP